jgi:hypothetical protein
MLCIEGDCHLRGIVNGHPNHKDDTMIITSKIVAYDGYFKDGMFNNVVKTTSGRTYYLLKHRDLDILDSKFGEKD